MLDKILPEMIELAEDIYRNPELGFREFKTREKVIEKLNKYGIEYKDVAYTGIIATIDSHKEGPHIGLIAEFDGVPTLGHPYANIEQNNVAHTCGHYAQMGTMLSVFVSLKDKLPCGKVSLLVTPGEEFCDMDYRKDLIKQGLLHCPSGKQEMIVTGAFDDIDIMLSCHAMGIDMDEWDAEIGSSLNGFIQKKVTFIGKASHAGANPEGGINALNAANLAMTGINFLRETFRAEDAIRVHFVLSEGGQTVNTVPSRCVLEMYVRAKKTNMIFEVNEKVERCLKAGAYAIGCDLEIQDTPGYFPLHQDEALTDFMQSHIQNYVTHIAKGTHGFASGDMGDISTLWPTIEIGTSGFTGTLHGKDFKTLDTNKAYVIPAHYFVDAVLDLLDNNGQKAYSIKKQFKPVMTKEAYIKRLEDLNKTQKYSHKEVIKWD